MLKQIKKMTFMEKSDKLIEKIIKCHFKGDKEGEEYFKDKFKKLCKDGTI